MHLQCAFQSATAVKCQTISLQSSSFIDKNAAAVFQALPERRATNRATPSMSREVPGVNNGKRIRRGDFLRLAVLGTASTLLLPEHACADSDIATYNGPISLGFSFSYPSSWIVKKKPIKTHLSEVIVTNDTEPATTAGLVVDTVKIDAIDKFGTPEAVGRKVVDVEMKKESVSSASVVGAESMTRNGLLYYIIDYVVDSSRGVKHYLAKATITGGQLYVFTAQAKSEGFEGETEDTLREMLDSFSVKKQYQ